MRTAFIIAQMLVAIAALVGLMAAVFYGVGWAVMFTMRFVPLIGKRHRHERWDELTKRSAARTASPAKRR